MPTLVFDSTFSECMEAIDCKMNHEMRVYLDDSDPVVTFCQQMIPHHANAVNMAKVLMKESPDSYDDTIDELLWDIINVQNQQVPINV